MKSPVRLNSVLELAFKKFKPTKYTNAIGKRVGSLSRQSSEFNRSLIASGNSMYRQTVNNLKALTKSASSEEHELIKQWQKSPSDQGLTKRVLKSIDPIVKTITGKWSGVLPQSALYVKAQTLALEALKDWDPGKGALSTYLYTRVQKVSRDVYSMQNAVKIPENHAYKIGTFERAYNNVQTKVNRAPTVEELADELTWSTDLVNRYLKYTQKEITATGMTDDIYGDTFVDFRPETMNALGLLHGTMSDKEKCVYDMTINSLIPPSGSEISSKCKVSQPDISKIKKKIAQNIINYRGY